VDHVSAGDGVFLEGPSPVGPGTVLGFHPGIVFAHRYVSAMPNFPLVREVSDLIHEHHDGARLDGQYWEDAEGRHSPNPAAATPNPAAASDSGGESTGMEVPGSRGDGLYRRRRRPADVHPGEWVDPSPPRVVSRDPALLSAWDALAGLKQRTPKVLTLAYKANHPPPGTRPNARLVPWRVHAAVSDEEAMRRLTAMRSLLPYAPYLPRTGGNGEKNASAPPRAFNAVAVVTERTIKPGDELFIGYRFTIDGIHPCSPSWAVPIDPEVDARLREPLFNHLVGRLRS